MKKIPYTVFILSGYLAIFQCLLATNLAGQKPNVIIINIDNLHPKVLGFCGNSFVETPNIDDFARESVYFTHYTVASRCAPSRSCLMTGRHYLRTGSVETRFNMQFMQRNEKTIADHFKTNGYATCMIGKWHLGNTFPYRPEDRGFDYVVTCLDNISKEMPFGLRHNGVWRIHNRFRGEVLFEEALSFISENRDTTFLLYLAPSMVHGPNVGPEELFRKYSEKLTDEEKLLIQESLARNKGQGGKSPEDYIHNMLHLYAEMEFIDMAFGDILQLLKDLNIKNNTLIFFCSDGQGGTGPVIHHKKGYPEIAEHSTLALMCFPGAGWSGNRRIETRVANYDLLPTLIDICRLESIAGTSFDGQSMLPLLEGHPDDWKDRIMIIDHQASFRNLPDWPQPHLLPFYRTKILGFNGEIVWADGRITRNTLNAEQTEAVTVHYKEFWRKCMNDYEPYKYLIAGSEQQDTLVAPDYYASALPGSSLKEDGEEIILRWPVEFARGGDYVVEFWKVPSKSWLPFQSDPYKDISKVSLYINDKEYKWKPGEGSSAMPHYRIRVEVGKKWIGGIEYRGKHNSTPEMLLIYPVSSKMSIN